MALTFTESRKIPSLRSVRVIGTLVASGNYATGGEVPSGLNKPGTTKDPIRVEIHNRGDHTFKYDAATGKVLVYAAGGAQLAAAAYPAGVTSDLVTMEVEYPKLG